MTPEEFLNIINVLPQIAIAVLFAVFVREERKANAQAARQVMDDWAKRMERQEEIWRTFITDQRVAQNEAIGRLAEEIKSVASMVQVNNALITNHDNYMRNNEPRKS